MEQTKSIWFTTLLLTLVAGYCDTVTFISAKAIFSAHVTGNFIVFAYELIKGSEAAAYIKLLTFPVFIIAVMFAGWLAAKVVNRYKLLLYEGILLLLSGLAAGWFEYYDMLTISWPVYTIAMVVVFAIGLQNAYGKLFPKETYGPTTMMTGNVTQLSLDLGGLFKPERKEEAKASLKKQLITVGGFLAGCVLGAVLAHGYGLVTLVLPGIAIIICYLYSNKKATGATHA